MLIGDYIIITENSAVPMGHKFGCITHKDCIHRTPIDCVTLQDLFKRIELLESQIKTKENEAVVLKARIFDLLEEGR